MKNIVNFAPGTTDGDAIALKLYELDMVFREKLSNTVLSKLVSIPTIDSVKAGKAAYIHDKDGNQIGFGNRDEVIKYITMWDSQRGGTIQFAGVSPLTGQGITGTSGKRLVDNTEGMDVGTFELTLEEYGHAMKSNSRLGLKFSQIDLLSEMINLLMTWSVEKIEKLMMNALYDSPSTIVYPKTYTAITDLTSSDTITLQDLRKANLIATTRGTTGRNIVEPLTIRGKKYTIALMSPEDLYTLKNDAEYKSALQNAGVRGPENELFQGADFITYDGIVCVQSEYVPTPTNYGSAGTLPGSRIKILGKNALLMGFGGAAPEIREEKMDLGRETVYGALFMFAARKPTLNGRDFGSVELRVARNAVTGY